MPEDHQQGYMQMLSAVFKASYLGIGSYICRNADYEQVPESMIKNYFWWNSRIGATKNFSVWMLSRHQLSPAVWRFMWMLITVRHVVSVTRFQLRQNRIRSDFLFGILCWRE